MIATPTIPGVTVGLYTHCRHDHDDPADLAIGDPPTRRRTDIATTRGYKDWTPAERAAFAVVVRQIGASGRFSVGAVAQAARCTNKQAVAGMLGLHLARVAVRHKKQSAWELIPEETQ